MGEQKMFNLLSWWLGGAIGFIMAYGVKNNERFRAINPKFITIKENGEVVTFLRNYNSETGYFKYKYIAWMEWGGYCTSQAILHSFVNQTMYNRSIILLIGLLLANHIAYKRYKTI